MLTSAVFMIMGERISKIVRMMMMIVSMPVIMGVGMSMMIVSVSPKVNIHRFKGYPANEHTHKQRHGGGCFPAVLYRPKIKLTLHGLQFM